MIVTTGMKRERWMLSREAMTTGDAAMAARIAVGDLRLRPELETPSFVMFLSEETNQAVLVYSFQVPPQDRDMMLWFHVDLIDLKGGGELNEATFHVVEAKRR